MIVNYIGGDTWARALRYLARHGRMLTCGATAGFQPPSDLRFIFGFEQQMIGSNGGLPAEQVELLDRVARGEIRPRIHAVPPLEGVRAPFQERIDRRVFGKTVITPA